MEILRNSVWDIKTFQGFGAGLYRILKLDEEFNYVILFPIIEPIAEGRPAIADFRTFQTAISEQDVLKASFKLPVYMLSDEDEISENHRAYRDRQYNLIKALVSDEEFLIQISTSKRAKGINIHAKKVGSDSKKITRLLKLFWKYGQTPDALLPAYSKCGGYGKLKTVKSLPMGRPKKARTVAVERARNFIVTEEDKDKFRKILSVHVLKPHGKSIPKAYDELLRAYYFDEIKMANALGTVPNVPSLAQLRYWKEKLFDKAETAKRTTTERDYLLNRRGVSGSTSTKWSVPGDCFEIDATVADVHIVSEWSSNLILGRPTIYSVVDRATGVVCGLNVSLFYASWRAARQALANTFLPKADYCKEFGINIQDSDWPVNHIPLTLMCDNGEMIGLNPQKLVVPLTELQLSPPYRPDFKSMVEVRYGLLNKELIHDLSGTTRGGVVIRGDKDPRKDAIYTLKQFTTLLIDAALELNRTKYDRLAKSNALLIKYDLLPTPINYWKVNVASYKHSLQVADIDVVISRMYPPAKATMTKHAIEYNGLYYSNERVIKDDLTTIARTHGNWQLDARINENTTNFIYVKFDKNENFVKCNLLQRSNMFENKPMYEADAFNDWLDQSKAKSPISIESIDSRKMRKEEERVAKSNQDENTIPFAKKIKNMRESRKNEISSTSNAIEDKQESIQSTQVAKLVDQPKGKKVHLPRRPKGK
ncbi:Tn7-like transposition protein B [Paraglaciecola mesophila KMM 241]|uniref:Tn7-like transposition protein B n=1 Tax=Paraglaciecola mesophila KMM 241 TaxID=1128912 RepID=K6Z3Z8_9ALTE|nr:hypothetical protein [Paraglaciecola mesophila]GAC25107.1 Tn7-like transposition protein B [Paraglaciecola mesophila KMM 241]